MSLFGRGSTSHNGDRLYLERAYELARRALGNTSPNPPVGALFVRDGVTLGEGFHRRAGEAHAEMEALQNAGGDVRGATLYVSLEPCNHEGRPGRCAPALVAAGVARIVIGTLDPNPASRGRGVSAFQTAGIEVEVADDPAALRLVEPFAVAIVSPRPYVALKLAASLDGCIAPAPGRYWLTGDAVRAFAHDLRYAHDAVMVGAGTVRVDDPLLTVRPSRSRHVPFARVIVCESGPVPVESRVFAPPEGQRSRPTIVLAPAGLRSTFAALENVAQVISVGDAGSSQLDLPLALAALKEAGVQSVLCEGGPTLAGRLLERGLVDRLYWFVAPALLRNEAAVPALAAANVSRFARGWHFDDVRRFDEDVLLTGRLHV